jgi:hypothetical protein
MTGDAFTFVAPEEKGPRGHRAGDRPALPRVTVPDFDYTRAAPKSGSRSRSRSASPRSARARRGAPGTGVALSPRRVLTPSIRKETAMSTQAHAVAELESIEEQVAGTKTVIEATVIVTAVGPADLSFSSSSPAISIKDKDITLQPLSSQQQPVLYNLLFLVGEGIRSFDTPAAEFRTDEKKAALAVNPGGFGQEFSLSFINDLAPASEPVLYDFDISWIASVEPGVEGALVVRRRVTDPTIVLGPPNS